MGITKTQLYCLNGKGFDEFSEEKNLGCNFEEALDKGICIGSGVNRHKDQEKMVPNILMKMAS